MKASFRYWGGAACLWLLFFGAGVGLLRQSGAFKAEFGEYPDEPAHYVTGLLVRDYLVGGLQQPPMQFAERYYAHYPKVALGHYPPFLYVVEAAWMSVLPVSRPSLLLLNALLTALTGAMLCLAARREFGAWAGIGAGLLWIALPLTQTYCGMVMAEPLNICLVFGAGLCYGRYLETERWRYSAWFGILASLGILTKQMTILLALVPPIAVLLARRWHLIRRFSFWLPALLVAVLTGPWYLIARLYTPGRSLAGLASLGLVPSPLISDLLQIQGMNGYAVLALVVIGFWDRLLSPVLGGRRVTGPWAAWAGLVTGFLIVRRVSPSAFEPRHLLNVEPALLLFAVAGVAWLAMRLPPARLGVRWRATALTLVVGAAFAVGTFRIPERRYYGYSEAAAWLVADHDAGAGIVLVCSDAMGEGALTAEVAAREHRPGHFVLRGNRMLASSNWQGGRYILRYQTAAEVAWFMDRVHVDTLILETVSGRPRQPHSALAEQAVRQRPDLWRREAVFPKLRAASLSGVEVTAYRYAGTYSGPPGEIDIEMTQTLQRSIRLQP